jgi:Kef-type K+ transport system membrane component KefB/mannitol/fructose-specific phosphotransferase system IIA component (Ntr-type)
MRILQEEAMKIPRLVSLVLFIIVIPGSLWAMEPGEHDLASQMTRIVLQLAIVIFAVRAGGGLAQRLKLPSVIGELLAGVLIGPYAFGALAIPGFPLGLFPLSPDFAVSPELYAFSTIASIILLFSSGLETNIDMLLHYSFAGSMVGLGGALLSFGTGAGLAALLTHQSVFSPASMFLGIMSTATSVGITARILSDRKKMDSPEGVTILAAAVFDDVLGIVLLAIVMGLTSALGGSGQASLSPAAITGIALKAFAIWLGFTAIGLLFGKAISSVLKKMGGESTYPVLALGLAFLLAGFFEMQGLAMIIGAYIVGISLSKTDIAFLIQDKTKPLYDFFVPIFFAIMGMLVDVGQILNPKVLMLGIIYTIAAVLAKIGGCGLPALFLGFNIRGALRIGIGMVPRGEVALIIAGIGLAGGILEPSVFGVVILMIMATSIIAPPLLSIALSRGGHGTRKPVRNENSESIRIEFPNREIAELVSSTFLKDLEREGFFVQLMSIRDEISHIRKGDIAISLVSEKNGITLETAPEDIPFLRASLHEVLVKLDASFEKLKENYDFERSKNEIHVETGRVDRGFKKLLDPHCVTTRLTGNTKEAVIEELVDLLDHAGHVENKTILLNDILDREKRMSTGMEHSIALPHARSLGVSAQALAIGIHREGIDFGTIDGTPGRIIALIASPALGDAPHMQALASLGAVLGDEGRRMRIIGARTDTEAYDLLTGKA